MKKLSFLAMAAFGLLFAACSSDRDVADQSETPFEGQGAGFFKVSLNLPTNVVSSTRAGEGWGESTTGNLDDGETYEYAVDNILLILFQGTLESNAKVIQWNEITQDKTDVEDTPNQITNKREKVVKLDKEPTSNLYALAVLNGKGVIEKGSAQNKIVVNGTEKTDATLADLQEAAIEKPITYYTDASDNKFFYMTNAVLSNKKGGATAPTGAGLQVLVPINSGLIYKTEAEANSGSAAADIYVERGAAKVTLTSTSLTNTSIKKGATTVAVALNGWVLDNTNKFAYPVRRTPSGMDWTLTSKATIGTDAYRFVGGNAVDKANGTETLYRTYWAEDPNYTADYDAANFNKVTTLVTDATEMAKPQYCNENTFNVAHQTSQNTTRAIVGIKIGDGTAFLVVGADRRTLYTQDEVNKLVKAALLNQTAFETYVTNKSTSVGETNLTVSYQIKNAGGTWSDWDGSTAGLIKVKDIAISGTSPSIDGNLSAITDLDGKTPTPTSGSDAIAVINAALPDIEYFAGGISYYEVRIKHFGDELTPWNATGTAKEWKDTYQPKESAIADIYPAADDSRQDANYLGRYGMVRNNWYEIKLDEVLRVGHATVPDITNHPDDDLEDYYIKARINILSWAKRTQSWNLK